MISDLASTNKNFYASNQVMLRLIYLFLGLSAISQYTRGFYHLFNVLIDKVVVCI